MPKSRLLVGGAALPRLCLAWLAPGLSWAADSRVALRGHVPAQVRGATALGRVSADEKVVLGLVVRLDQDLLDRTVAQLYDPQSPSYKRFLSPAEFAQKFDLAGRRQRLKDFARAEGLAVSQTDDRPTSQVVRVSGPAAVVERAFGVRLQRYRGADGQVFRAHDTEPQVPAALGASLRGVAGLSKIHGIMKPRLSLRRPLPAPYGQQTQAVPPSAALPSALTISGGHGPRGGLAPADIKSIYGVSGALTGSGQKVALMEFDGYRPDDINLYESLFGLPRASVTFVSVSGQQNLCGADQDQNCDTMEPSLDGNMIEVALDIELLIGLAPGLSQVLVYTAHNDGLGFLDILDQMAIDNTAKAISISWGRAQGYGELEDLESQIFAQLASQGQSVFAAAGDAGAYDAKSTALKVDDPAAQPYVSGVGGTSLDGTIGGTITETVWNNYCYSGGATCKGGGGGIANYVESGNIYWSIPSYQTGVSGKYSAIYRNVPDVALNADPYSSPYGICLGGTCDDLVYDLTLVGGTSAAAPLWTALTALANQKLASGGFGVVGFANPSLYEIAGGSSYGSSFKDITSGGNGLPGGIYQAGTGYDNASGWGSFKGDALIDALYGLHHPAAAPQNFTAATLGTSSITWTWDSVEGATYYKVYYASNTSQLAATVGATRATLDFPPNTLSAVTVRGVNSAGEGPGGTSPSTATLALALTSTNSTVAHISSITVSWNICAANACAGYVLEASPNADFSPPVFSSATPNYALGRLQVSGLSKLTQYHLRVGTLNWSRGANYYILPRTTTTLTDLVAPGPGSPEFSGITARSIVFNWIRNGNPYPTTYQADCSSMPTFVPYA
ncbi:MAG: protease pro-enzyme activation domain-containing protein, partial [Elusimicrobia bacterium]|nr:protease pro-enzyme activation domain-containing protein [Elusimicrobiota bacterium]